SVTALETRSRPNSRRLLVLARLATLASPAPALPMRLLLTMTVVNIQAHREHREIIYFNIWIFHHVILTQNKMFIT
ncbi:MAG: hypothetical protein KJ757_07745, partial [Planctomycetes bacterium]|nr:hypothetical protein [Planctomycetota bacterium]